MTARVHSRIRRCRVCAGSDLKTIVDLGRQPPANALRKLRRERPPRIPLVLVRCRGCGAVQISQSVRPESLFRSYVWVTSTSPSTREYAGRFCHEVLRRGRGRPRLIVEVASNDGTFLRPFVDQGLPVLGIDPARNIAALARQAGVPTEAEFFGSAFAARLTRRHGLADVVIARNVLPHVERAPDVVAGMAKLLSPRGLAVVEFHHAAVILAELHYDSIYHEHNLYLSLEGTRDLLASHGLFVFDVIRSAISGGSLVVFASPAPRPSSRRLERAVADEREVGVHLERPWLGFARRCEQHRRQLRRLVEQARAEGPIIGYGASARSSTLLNYCGIDHRHLACIADQNALKHAHFTPGADIPIVSPEEAFRTRPRTVLLLGWNFEREILRTIRSRFHFRGQVIVPLPGECRVIRVG